MILWRDNITQYFIYLKNDFAQVAELAFLGAGEQTGTALPPINRFGNC